jgi:hypothetical protein
MKFRKDFIGLDGFHWWFGVVENRIDPLLLGRCQVRIFGVHSADLTDIPSEDLPWALPVHALNNQTFSTPKEGDYVFGFFLDGTYAQQPVMVGIVPGIPQEQTDPNVGFADLRTPEDIANAPKKPNSVTLPTDGTGAEIEEVEDEESLAALRNPSVFQIGFPTNSDLARNQNIETTIVQLKEDNLVEVPSTYGASWKEPAPAYDAEYPYNKVLETESGHVMEFDDTPGAERVSLSHRSGTFEEVYPTGTKVEKVVKNNYKVVLRDDHLYVSGKVKVTIDSDADIVVLGNVNLEAYNDLNATVAGSVNYTVGEDFNVKAENINLEANSYISQIANSAVLITSKGDEDESGVFISSADGSVGISGGEVSMYSSSGITMTALTDVSTSATGFITAQAAGAISMQSGLTFGLSTGGAMSIAAGAAVAVEAVGAVSLVAGGAIAGAAAGGIGWTAGGVFSAIAGLKASIFSGLGTDIDMLPIPIPPIPLPPVIIPTIPGGEVAPAYETGLGPAPARVQYFDQAPFFEREKRVRIPQEVQEEIDNRITEYVKNPRVFYNQDAVDSGVKENYPGSPETPAEVGESLIQNYNPNITDGSDLRAWLAEQLEKTNSEGFWLETGMGGKPSNQNIIGIWDDLGFGRRGAWGTDQTPWCMGFINYALKQNGYRYVQTARAFDIRDRLNQYGAERVLNMTDAQPGDIALWSFSHVNFVYSNDNGNLSFVGGNQRPNSPLSDNNPSQGDVTISNPPLNKLIGIYRPVKV